MLAMDNKVADWQVTVEHGSDVQETGIAAGLFESTLKLVTVIFLRLVKHQSTTVQDIYQGLRNEARLYYLWGEGYSPASGYLDNILSLSVDLRATVLSLMASWARALSKSMFFYAALIDILSHTPLDVRTYIHCHPH